MVNKSVRLFQFAISNVICLVNPQNGSWDLFNMAANAKCKCEFANKCAQANERCSKELSPGFTLCFAFLQSKATDPILRNLIY